MINAPDGYSTKGIVLDKNASTSRFGQRYTYFQGAYAGQELEAYFTIRVPAVSAGENRAKNSTVEVARNFNLPDGVTDRDLAGYMTLYRDGLAAYDKPYTIYVRMVFVINDTTETDTLYGKYVSTIVVEFPN